MSFELHDRVTRALKEARENAVQRLRKCKPRSPIQMQDGAVIDASGCEEIALAAVDINATVDALDLALRILDDEWKRIQRPDVDVEVEDETKQRGSIYG